MPTYTYRFEDYTIVEMEQSMSDEPFKELEHPDTGEWEPVKRVPSIPGVAFKGSGFYKTDKGK